MMLRTLLLLAAFAAPASALAENLQSSQVVKMLAMAQACSIKIPTPVVLWLAELDKNMPADEAEKLAKDARQEIARDFAQQGQIGACYQLRATLFRDGLL